MKIKAILLKSEQNKSLAVDAGRKIKAMLSKKLFVCQYRDCHSNLHLKRRGTDWGLYRVLLHVSLFSVIAFLVLKKYVYWPKSQLLFWEKASGNWCLGIGGGLLRLGVGLAEKETIVRRQSHFVL